MPRYCWISQNGEPKQLLCPSEEGVSLLAKWLTAHGFCQIWASQPRLWFLSQIWCLPMPFITPAGDCWRAVCKVCAAAFQKSCPLSKASCYELTAPEVSEYSECSVYGCNSEGIVCKWRCPCWPFPQLWLVARHNQVSFSSAVGLAIIFWGLGASQLIS